MRQRRSSERTGQRFATIRQVVLQRSGRRQPVGLACAVDIWRGGHNSWPSRGERYFDGYDNENCRSKYTQAGKEISENPAVLASVSQTFAAT